MGGCDADARPLRLADFTADSRSFNPAGDTLYAPPTGGPCGTEASHRPHVHRHASQVSGTRTRNRWAPASPVVHARGLFFCSLMSIARRRNTPRVWKLSPGACVAGITVASLDLGRGYVLFPNTGYSGAHAEQRRPQEHQAMNPMPTTSNGRFCSDAAMSSKPTPRKTHE